MKKIFGFGSKKGESPLGSSISPGRDGGHRINLQPGYRIRDKDLGKIHKAAIVGNVAKVQQILLLGKNGLNDRDKMNRTALHLACANGHSAVVTLLLERKCLLNLCDNENRTALMKAVECQEEECATLLLEHGADPNVMDVSGNTALHYAVFCQNISLAAKLLSYDANIEARNKDDLTPLSLAVSERKQQMVEFLAKKEANIHAVDKMQRYHVLMYSPFFTVVEAKCGIVRPESTTFSEDNNSDSEIEDVVETIPEPSPGVQGFSHPAFPSEGATKPEIVDKESDTDIIERAPQEQINHDHLSSVDATHKNNRSDMMSALGLGEEEDIESPWDSESISESLPQKYVDLLSGAAGQRGKNTLNGQVEDVSYIPSCMIGSRNFKMAKLEEPRHVGIPVAHMGMKQSEYFYEPLFYKCVSYDPDVHRKEVKKKDNRKWTPEGCVTAPIFEKTDSLTGGLLHVNDDSILSEVDQDDDSLLKIRDTILSYERLVELKKSHCELLKGKIKKMESKVRGLQKELSETKEVKSQLEHQKVEWERELGSLRFTLKQEEEQRRNADMLYEKIREQLRRKEDQYSKEVEMKQQLELTLRALEMELKTVRNDLNQVIEERNDTQKQLSRERNARILQDGILANHLAKQKEIEMANKEMNSEVSDSCEEAKDLLHKNHMLQEEIAMLRLEMDAVKIQNQEKEKKYFEDIEIVKGKNDDLQKAIKLNEETLTKTVSHYTGQLNALTAENAMLNSKLENEKESKQRLETEVESYRSRLAAASHDHDQCQTSKRDLELAFQRARDEWLHLQDKMKSDAANLKDNNEMLSQQLSRAESKFNNLEIKLHHTRDSLREKILMLERVQRDLSQTECQKQEIEHMYQNEQGKVNKYIGKQESLEERLSQLQSENMLLRQQLDDAQNKADSKEKTVISIQDQFQQIVRKLHAESEKQGLMLEERNKELVKECDHLKERMYQYENEKAEREVSVRQLQQELADTLKKQSMSEASLEVLSRYRANLEVEAQDLKKKLGQLTSQVCMKLNLFKNNFLKLFFSKSEDEKEQLKKYIELKQSLENSLDQEKKKNSELEKEITGFKKLLKMTRRKLNEYENGELSFHGDLKTSQTEMDIQINKLKHKIEDLTAELEAASSKCLHLDAKNQVLREELLSMKGMQKKCEKLEEKKKKLEQEVVYLRSHIEMNMIEHSQVEQYKREIEERARQDLVEKLKEVNLFLQIQAASQENLEQLQEKNNASIRSQMELRIKDLESELSKVKTLQEDSHKAELEKYKQLYLVELEVRKSLEGKLDKTHERLAVISTKLEVEKEQNRSLLSTLSTRPVLEPPCVGNFNNPVVLNGNLTPRANVGFSTSIPRPSNNSMETYLTKMRQELDRSITRELREAAAEFESESYGLSPLGATDGSNLSEDLLLKTSQEYVQILKKKYMI
uniref:Ankyrin repeat domain-containing protein 26-like n=1 Tax=Bos indicus x Bos taurus TaxID=30522 RepID=A0A4W2FYD7_BOBOX